MKSKEELLNSVVLAVVNKKSYEDLLDELEYYEYLDMVVICKMRVLRADNQDGISVGKETVKRLGISKEELFKRAYQNTIERYTAVILNMKDVIASIFSSEEAAQLGIEGDIKDLDIDEQLIITNNTYFGSTVILNKSFMAYIGEKLGHDYYVVPMSIKECYVLCEELDEEGLNYYKECLCAVSKNDISPEERLGEHLYKFDIKKKELQIVD